VLQSCRQTTAAAAAAAEPRRIVHGEVKQFIVY